MSDHPTDALVAPPVRTGAPSSGEGAPEDGDPLLGRTIAGKFVIERRLGAGAMGAVYRAQQTALDRPVAIKVMHGGFAADENYAARFHREAKAASRLDHPNLIRVHDYGEEPDGLLYIAMEYLDCRDLFTILAEDWPLPQERIVDLLSQILSGLAEAHQAGVLHRDLKPENIMVLRRKAEDGEPIDVVKVCDFGIAKFVDADEEAKEHGTPAKRKLTTAGLVIGTPEYMSPEQARGDAYDARSDLYAVGVILYELLTRRLPFEGKTSVEVVFKAMHEEPARLDAYGPTAAPALDAICLKAMSKYPEDRYQSAREMRAALRATRNGATSSTLPPSPFAPSPYAAPRAEPAETLALRPEEVSSPGTEGPAEPRSARGLNRFLAALAVVLWAVVLLVHPRSPAPMAGLPGSGAPTRPPTPVSPPAPDDRTSDRAASPPGGTATSPGPVAAPSTVASASAPSPRPARRGSREPLAPVSPPSDPLAPSSAAPVERPSGTTAAVPAPGGEVSAAASSPSASSALAPSPAAASAPVPPPSVAAPPPAPPPFNVATARVELGRVKCNSAAVMSGSVSRTFSPLLPRFTTCYRTALVEGAGRAGEAVATLHLESDDEGYVTVARVSGASSSGAARCIEGISREVHLAVDTGTANVDLTLVFKPL